MINFAINSLRFMGEILLTFLFFAIALGVLLQAAQWFINSAERIGLAFGVEPFIIGITVVAFGTSLPELATSISSIYAGQSEIIVGNVIGSNVTNIALVIGVIAVMRKEIYIESDIMHIDIPKLLAATMFLWFILADFKVTIFEAIICVIGLIIFIMYSVTADRLLNVKERPKLQWKDFVLMVVGVVLVYFGSVYTIKYASELATMAGIPVKIIGFTLIAFGTSLPELIISVQAMRKGKSGIAVGNVLGSNIFNSFCVMGIPAFFGHISIPEAIFDFTLPFMVMLTVLFAFMCMTRRISRWEGMILLLLYVFFNVKLFF
jgi:cation:H+ antiporter